MVESNNWKRETFKPNPYYTMPRSWGFQSKLLTLQDIEEKEARRIEKERLKAARLEQEKAEKNRDDTKKSS